MIRLKYFSGKNPEPPPDTEERMRVMERHIKMLVEFKGEVIGMKEARMQTGWYLKGMHGAAKFRARCGSLSTLDDLQRLIDEVLSR